MAKAETETVPDADAEKAKAERKQPEQKKEGDKLPSVFEKMKVTTRWKEYWKYCLTAMDF